VLGADVEQDAQCLDVLAARLGERRSSAKLSTGLDVGTASNYRDSQLRASLCNLTHCRNRPGSTELTC
jgi:hypothetical protein